MGVAHAEDVGVVVRVDRLHALRVVWADRPGVFNDTEFCRQASCVYAKGICQPALHHRRVAEEAVGPCRQRRRADPPRQRMTHRQRIRHVPAEIEPCSCPMLEQNCILVVTIDFRVGRRAVVVVVTATAAAILDSMVRFACFFC